MAVKRMRVGIVDDNREFCQVLEELLGNSECFSVAFVAHDGCDALRLLRTEQVDLLVLDIVMPIIDGLGVLEGMANSDTVSKKPKVVVLTAIGKEELTRRAQALGADYCIMKPFDSDLLVKRLEDMCSCRSDSEQVLTDTKGQGDADVAARLLSKMGLSSHIKGYGYLVDAIEIGVRDPSNLNQITTVLYPEVSRRHRTTPSRVERAIRHAIERLWDRGDKDYIAKVVGRSFSEHQRRPSNSTFIAKVADAIRLGEVDKKG